MSLSDRLGAALARLSGALDHLESAAERRAEADAGRADIDLEFTLLQDDRSRLASELDGALTRAAALLAANSQVSARLAHASSTVQAVLAHYESAEQDDEPGHAATPLAWRAGVGAGE